MKKEEKSAQEYFPVSDGAKWVSIMCWWWVNEYIEYANKPKKRSLETIQSSVGLLCDLANSAETIIIYKYGH